MEKTTTRHTPLLSVTEVSKSFGGFDVLKKASLEISKGEIHALMGENGAGKSTLMKIIAGIHEKDAGTIVFKNSEVNFRTPAEGLAAGISMIHQELNAIMDMSVAENIFLGREPTLMFGIVNRALMFSNTRSLLKKFDIALSPDTLMKELSVADMQMIEIAKAVSYDAEVIIMDEPTSALSAREVEKLFSVIRELKAKGVSVIYISHRMEEIFSICDAITILRDGESITSGPASAFNSASLIKAMVGRQVSEIFPEPSAFSAQEILSVSDLSSKGKFSDVSFTLHKGEILGLAGLMGAGRTEVVEALFGIAPADSGEIRINGKRSVILTPAAAISKGMAFVSEDRKREGVLINASVKNNISLVNLKAYCAAGQILQLKKEKKAVNEIVDQLKIKIAGSDQLVEMLSGGNQQKVALAKWLITDFDILILDEPTRGIDIGAKAGIYQLIAELAANGKAIIMVSSEISEILGLCHRTLVMCEGKITANIKRKDFAQETIMKAAMPA